MVFQRPCGTLVGSLWPRGAPELRAYLRQRAALFALLGRGNLPPKSRRPLPSITRIELSRFYAHRRTLSEMVFLKLRFSAWTNSPYRPVINL